MRKLDFFRLPALSCAGMAAGAGSLKKSNFLMFSKVLRKAPDQAKFHEFRKSERIIRLIYTYDSGINYNIRRARPT